MRLIVAVLAWWVLAGPANAQDVFVEAESFRELGGWSIDTATTLTVGSPYLLAHGLGRPVTDAETTIDVPKSGTYHVWVRTKDWVARWNAPGTPGRFCIGIDKKLLTTEFGTRSSEWHWQSGGEVELTRGAHMLSLRDLTGFNGRCDAILLSASSEPPPTGKALHTARRRWIGVNAPPIDLEYDLVVVGGGYSGVAAALSAARQSLRVALIQDRMVLGGNGSSEIRVWANGGTMRGRYPHIGEIVEEFADHAPDSPGAADHYGDLLKEAVCRREPTLDLYLGHFARDVSVDTTRRITSVTALEVRTGIERRFRGVLFADCTGHGTIGALAGADFEVKPLGRMGMSNMWYWQNSDQAATWPETPWALPLAVGDFPRTPGSRSRIEGRPFFKGEWFWESGFDQHPIDDLEHIRDWNLRAVYGAFSALKRSGKHPKASLEWVAHVGGTRESRLLRGDVVLSSEDIVAKRDFPDGCVTTTWDIDLHYPKERYAKKFPDNPFISRAEFGAGVDRDEGYAVPYRCFYSRNIPNLFMAGRCISVTHEALGTIRVMRTCGMMGEVVGKAAYLCVRHDALPRAVYADHLGSLIELLKQPGAMRRATLTGDLLRDASIGRVRGYRTKGQDEVDGMEPKPGVSIAVASLPGIVVDDAHAEFTGSWLRGGLSPYVGKGYRYAAPRSEATARFSLDIREAGRYRVNIAWVPHENRGRAVRCTIERHDARPLRLRIDQSIASANSTTTAGAELFHLVGEFDFAAGPCSIVLSAAGVEGHVHADAVQLLKVQ